MSECGVGCNIISMRCRRRTVASANTDSWSWDRGARSAARHSNANVGAQAVRHGNTYTKSYGNSHTAAYGYSETVSHSNAYSSAHVHARATSHRNRNAAAHIHPKTASNGHARTESHSRPACRQQGRQYGYDPSGNGDVRPSNPRVDAKVGSSRRRDSDGKGWAVGTR